MSLVASHAPPSSPAPELRVLRPVWKPRSLPDLLHDQLAAFVLFHSDRNVAERAVTAAGLSREQKLDAHRRVDVVRRQHQALLGAVKAALDTSGPPLPNLVPRMLLVHRNDWLRQRVAAALAERGIDVVAHLDNGADGIGVLVAEQPDVLLVEDALPQVTGLQMLVAARRYAPRTMLAVQVPYDDGVGPALHAGAVATFTRRIPPADIADGLARLVGTA